MKYCTLVIESEVGVRFKGLDPFVRRELVSSLKFEIPNARYMDVVRSGRWDGQVSFCTIGGASYFNLLDLLIPLIEKYGYEISEVEDNRIPFEFDIPEIDENVIAHKLWPEDHECAGQPIILRDYQVACINQFLKNPQCIQEIATAAGKTIVTATLSHLVEQHTGGRTIVIVPSKSLVTQTYKDYKNVGLDVGMFYGEQKDIGNKHIISTWQSLNSLDKMGTMDGVNVLDVFLSGVNCVINDEVHGAKASALKDILTGPMANIPLRWGLTGTIPPDDYSQMCLLVGIGDTVNSLTSKQLQDEGVLAECHVNIIQVQEKGNYGNYQSELKYLVMNPERMAYISEIIQDIAKSGNTVILVDRINAGELLEQNIEGSIFLSGRDKNAKRLEHYEEVAESNNKIIIATYGIASTGINIPRIFNLVMIEPGKSYIRVIQSIGRGIRKAKDKDYVNVWDIASILKYSNRHLGQRVRYYKKVQYPHSLKKVEFDSKGI